MYLTKTQLKKFDKTSLSKKSGTRVVLDMGNKTGSQPVSKHVEQFLGYYCYNSLEIRLWSKDLKHLIPGNGLPKLQG